MEELAKQTVKTLIILFFKILIVQLAKTKIESLTILIVKNRIINVRLSIFFYNNITSGDLKIQDSRFFILINHSI